MPVATLTPGALEEARERTLNLVAPLSTPMSRRRIPR